MKLLPRLPLDLELRVDRYRDMLHARGTTLTEDEAILRLVDEGLKVTMRHVPAIVLPFKRIALATNPKTEIVTHLWTAGYMTACGLPKKGNRHAAMLDRVNCKECRAKAPGPYRSPAK